MTFLLVLFFQFALAAESPDCTRSTQVETIALDDNSSDKRTISVKNYLCYEIGSAELYENQKLIGLFKYTANLERGHLTMFAKTLNADKTVKNSGACSFNPKTRTAPCLWVQPKNCPKIIESLTKIGSDERRTALSRTRKNNNSELKISVQAKTVDLRYLLAQNLNQEQISLQDLVNKMADRLPLPPGGRKQPKGSLFSSFLRHFENDINKNFQSLIDKKTWNPFDFETAGEYRYLLAQACTYADYKTRLVNVKDLPPNTEAQP